MAVDAGLKRFKPVSTLRKHRFQSNPFGGALVTMLCRKTVPTVGAALRIAVSRWRFNRRRREAEDRMASSLVKALLGGAPGFKEAIAATAGTYSGSTPTSQNQIKLQFNAAALSIARISSPFARFYPCNGGATNSVIRVRLLVPATSSPYLESGPRRAEGSAQPWLH